MEGKGEGEMLAIGITILFLFVRFSGASPDVYSWFGDCTVRSVFNWRWRRSDAFFYMVPNML